MSSSRERKRGPGQGRPPIGGPGRQVNMRLRPHEIDALDAYIALLGERMPRTEAVRRLMTHTLTGMKLPRANRVA
jgi:hypothetical protein